MQLKNSNNPNIKDYKTLSTNENKENSENNTSEDNQIKIVTESPEQIEKEEEFYEKNDNDENIIQKCYKQKNKIKYGIKTLLFGLFYCFYLTSIFFYIKSLEGCLKDDLVYCLVDDAISKYVYAGIKLLICCGIVSIVLLIQVLLKLTKINYIIIIVPYIVLFLNYKGVDLKNHGTYNMVAFLVVVPILTGLFYSIYYMFYSFYKKKLIRAIIILSIYSFFFIMYFYFSNCNNFYKGLGGVYLESDKNTDKCYMIRPKYCTMKYIDPFFDMSKYKGDCNGRWNTKKRFMKHLDKKLENINHFYYPRVEFANPKITYSEKLFNYVYDHIGGVKENPAEAEKAEVFVDFENDKGKITINLKKE